MEDKHKKFMTLTERFVKNSLSRKRYKAKISVKDYRGGRISVLCDMRIDISSVKTYELKDGVYSVCMDKDMGDTYLEFDPYSQDRKVDSNYINTYIINNRIKLAFLTDTFLNSVFKYSPNKDKIVPLTYIDFNKNKAGFLTHNSYGKKRVAMVDAENPFDLNSYNTFLRGFPGYLVLVRV